MAVICSRDLDHFIFVSPSQRCSACLALISQVVSEIFENGAHRTTERRRKYESIISSSCEPDSSGELK